MMYSNSHLDLNSRNANTVCGPLQNVVGLIFLLDLVATIPWYRRTVGRSMQNRSSTKGVRYLSGFWLVGVHSKNKK